MSFIEEENHYQKGILSDLQGAWLCLRSCTLDLAPSETVLRNRLLFHIDEAMSWESVRNLEQMKKSITLLANIIQHEKANNELQECITDIREIFEDVLILIKNGTSL